MDKIIIKGGTPLKGTIPISGAKNSMLPLMTASLLTDQEVTLTNVPDLVDVHSLAHLLNVLDVDTDFDPASKTMKLHMHDEGHCVAPYDIVRKMRASILVLGPLLARSGFADVSLPGGCAIGARPVNFHIDGLKALGAEIDIRDGYIVARAPGGLVGADYAMPIISVTGTENIMMAATLAKGTTRILNAALEPEVTDLAECLIKMGAKISGHGTSTITIEGVEKLGGTTHMVLPDRIETGSYAIAAAITGGELILKNTSLDLLPSFVDVLRAMGIEIHSVPEGIKVSGSPEKLKPARVRTQPFPGYATDLQAQLMALLCLIKGTSVIEEKIFENRMMHVPELNRMGADISVEGTTATIQGIKKFQGAQVMATDLRASMSLVLAALAAEGETTINRVYHLDRGYGNIDEKLSAVGASIQRVREGEEDSQGDTHALKAV
ncbi:MAG: UDP-N-acetylglucosamine 1-carboxyvinyltransferase [Alphaproteobacteria bacterium]